MKLPVEHFINEIKHKKIYYFYSDQLDNTTEKHYFVCVGFDSEVIILNCFTTKIQKKIEYVRSRGIDFSTLVFASPTPENGLTAECVVNCNDLFRHTFDEFKEMYESDGIDFKGVLEDKYYEQIYVGINNSILVEEETKLNICKTDSLNESI